mmetsp:Transcript_20368/g.56439  ORF Transcript_20368/g.56439 Transcript_20368/m.56439 type:complete len:283 (+) Transcript_20368:2439-3287(+)
MPKPAMRSFRPQENSWRTTRVRWPVWPPSSVSWRGGQRRLHVSWLTRSGSATSLRSSRAPTWICTPCCSGCSSSHRPLHCRIHTGRGRPPPFRRLPQESRRQHRLRALAERGSFPLVASSDDWLPIPSAFREGGLNLLRLPKKTAQLPVARLPDNGLGWLTCSWEACGLWSGEPPEDLPQHRAGNHQPAARAAFCTFPIALEKGRPHGGTTCLAARAGASLPSHNHSQWVCLLLEEAQDSGRLAVAAACGWASGSGRPWVPRGELCLLPPPPLYPISMVLPG